MQNFVSDSFILKNNLQTLMTLYILVNDSLQIENQSELMFAGNRKCILSQLYVTGTINSNLVVISHSSNICGQHLNSFSSPTRVIEDHKYVSDMLFFTQLSICVIGFAYMYVLFRTVTVRDKGMINFAIASGSHVYMKRTFIYTYV